MSKRFLFACAAALSLAAGCASQRSATVTDLQLARVPPNLLEGVNNQRMLVGTAQDAVARREIALQSARNEQRLAQQELAAAEADIPRVKTALDNATYNRDAAAHQRAEQELQALYARRDAARAHIRAADASVKLADAQKEEAKQRLDLALAQLDWEKYAALQRSRDPVVREVNSDQLLRRLQRGQARVQDAAAVVAARQSEASREQQAWRASTQRYENLRGFGGAGRGHW